MRQDSLHYARCLKILGQSPLFGNVIIVLLEDMLRIFHYKTRAKGETAISPEQASDRLYIIISGRARVSVYNSESGREHILFLIGPGDSFDLISLLDGEWHNAVATALDDSEKEASLAEGLNEAFEGARDAAGNFTEEVKTDIETALIDAKLKSVEPLGLTRDTVKEEEQSVTAQLAVEF